jgi:multidrug transporter EmrE-like cation transporter
MLDIVLFAGYTIGSVVSLILIKQWLAPALAGWRTGVGMTAPSLWVALGICLYVLSFLTWMVILARNELSLAYPIAIGLTLAFSGVAAVIFLGEAVSITRIAGMLLILVGIAFVVRS